MPSVDDKWLSLVNSYSLKMVRSFHVYGFKMCPWDLCFRLRLLICSFASPGKTKFKIRLFRLIAIKNFAVEYLMTFFLFKKVRFKNVCLATCVIQVFFFFITKGVLTGMSTDGGVQEMTASCAHCLRPQSCWSSRNFRWYFQPVQAPGNFQRVYYTPCRPLSGETEIGRTRHFYYSSLHLLERKTQGKGLTWASHCNRLLVRKRNFGILVTKKGFLLRTGLTVKRIAMLLWPCYKGSLRERYKTQPGLTHLNSRGKCKNIFKNTYISA